MSLATVHFVPREDLQLKAGMKLRDAEKLLILETLKQQKFNRTHAARVLGIGIRTLQRKLKQYRTLEPNLYLGGQG